MDSLYPIIGLLGILLPGLHLLLSVWTSVLLEVTQFLLGILKGLLQLHDLSLLLHVLGQMPSDLVS